MKLSETAKLLAVIAAAYPEKFHVDEFKIQLWHSLLNDIDYELANVAVQKHILESPYIPTISDIRKATVDITIPIENKIDAGTAWGEVMKAVRDYGYSRPEEALSSLSPLTRQVAERISWREICCCEEENLGVLRGQFMKIFNTLQEREKQDKLLPEKIKEQIKAIANSSIKYLNDENEKRKLIGEK